MCFMEITAYADTLLFKSVLLLFYVKIKLLHDAIEEPLTTEEPFTSEEHLTSEEPLV